MKFDATKVFTLYVMKTDLWGELTTAMVDSLTIRRMGLSYHEIADFIRDHIEQKFSVFYDVEQPTIETHIIKQFVQSTEWFDIARHIYTVLYNTAVMLRTTQADSYNISQELQEEFLNNESQFFEDKYLKIFSDFFSEIP